MLNIDQFMANLEKKHPGEKEFLQAVREVLISIKDVYDQHPEFERASLLERLVEPERIIIFRVPWVDDRGKTQVNHTREVSASTHRLTSRSSSSSVSNRRSRTRSPHSLWVAARVAPTSRPVARARPKSCVSASRS